jgi:hypothetical protein
MRTTVTLDEDVFRAVEQLRRERGYRTSEALNFLVRRGLAQPGTKSERFVQSVSNLGEPRVPLDDIASALELLEGEGHRL